MKNLLGAFIILIVGYILVTIAFAIEPFAIHLNVKCLLIAYLQCTMYTKTPQHKNRFKYIQFLYSLFRREDSWFAC